MSNVNHRYSSESWTLDLSAKRSPLSRWTGRDVLRDEEFRLSLLGAQGGIAPVVWLSGDRPCFEELHKTLETYVQQGLGEPVLAAKSTFPAGSQGAINSASGQFALEAQGLLRHSLNYSPQDSSSPRQMKLSMLQLADLLAVLDQWQTETLALPERQSRLKVLPGGKDTDFVVPTWGRIAASLVVAVGATGIGGYILSQNLPKNAQQIALESAPAESDAAAPASPSFGAPPSGAFGQFPTASGPPITSQAQEGDAAFNNPLVLPQDAQTPPPPDLGLPTLPLPNGDSGLGQIPLPQAAPPASSSPSGSIPPKTSGEDATIASAETGASSNAGLDNSPASPITPTSPTTDLSIGNALPGTTAEAPPQPEPTQEDSPLLADIPEADREISLDEEETFAAAPPLSQQPSPVLAPAPVESAKVDPGTIASETEAADLIASAPAATNSRAGQPIAANEPEPALAAPPAPPVPQVSVAKPLPGNNQSRAVQSYLQSQWQPPTAIQQPLQYRLRVSPEGNLASVEALSPTAQLYVNDAKLPPVGSAISGAADTVQSTMVVTLTPSGQVNVAVEATAPAAP